MGIPEDRARLGVIQQELYRLGRQMAMDPRKTALREQYKQLEKEYADIEARIQKTIREINFINYDPVRVHLGGTYVVAPKAAASFDGAHPFIQVGPTKTDATPHTLRRPAYEDIRGGYQFWIDIQRDPAIRDRAPGNDFWGEYVLKSGRVHALYYWTIPWVQEKMMKDAKEEYYSTVWTFWRYDTGQQAMDPEYDTPYIIQNYQTKQWLAKGGDSLTTYPSKDSATVFRFERFDGDAGSTVITNKDLISKIREAQAKCAQDPEIFNDDVKFAACIAGKAIGTGGGEIVKDGAEKANEFVKGVWESIKKELGIDSIFDLPSLIPWWVWAIVALLALSAVAPIINILK